MMSFGMPKVVYVIQNLNADSWTVGARTELAYGAFTTYEGALHALRQEWCGKHDDETILTYFSIIPLTLTS